MSLLINAFHISYVIAPAVIWCKLQKSQKIIAVMLNCYFCHYRTDRMSPGYGYGYGKSWHLVGPFSGL